MFATLVGRIVKMFTSPKAFWEKMLGESGEIKDLLIPQMLILAAIPVLAQLIGGLVQAAQLAKFVPVGRFAGAAVVAAIVGYGLNIGVWIAFGILIDILANSFGAQRDQGQAMKLAAGAVIPMWLGQILHLTTISALGLIGSLAGLGYGAYLLYLGLPLLNGTPQEKAVTYTIAAVACLFGLGLVAGILTCIPVSCCVGSSFIR